jgi:hypothetical protein
MVQVSAGDSLRNSHKRKLANDRALSCQQQLRRLCSSQRRFAAADLVLCRSRHRCFLFFGVEHHLRASVMFVQGPNVGPVRWCCCCWRDLRSKHPHPHCVDAKPNTIHVVQHFAPLCACARPVKRGVGALMYSVHTRTHRRALAWLRSSIRELVA